MKSQSWMAISAYCSFEVFQTIGMKEDDSFELDAEAVDEFYDNMDVLLSRNARENKRIKELEKELSEIRNSYYRQKKTLDRYIKVYGEDVMNV